MSLHRCRQAFIVDPLRLCWTNTIHKQEEPREGPVICESWPRCPSRVGSTRVQLRKLATMPLRISSTSGHRSSGAEALRV